MSSVGRLKIVIESLAYASLIISFNFFVGLLAFFISQMDMFSVAGVLTILEFGFLLIVGGCLAAREPLDDEKKYTSNGTVTTSQRASEFGKKLLLTAIFMLLLGLCLSFFLDLLYPLFASTAKAVPQTVL